MSFKMLVLATVRLLSTQTAKQTCGSRLGSVCASTTEAMQQILKNVWTHWRP